MQTAYETLGVSKTATQDEIKSAYRKLAKKFHPDLNPGNKEAEKKFKAINQANEEIGTPGEREKYDRGESENAQSQNAHAQAARGARGSSSGAENQNYYYQTQGGGAGAGAQGRYSSAFGGMDEDLFESIFGGAARGGTSSGGARGFGGEASAHETYQMEIEFKDSILGAEREITLPGGKRLAIKIPPGIEAGKKLRFGGQAAGGGDVLIEIKIKSSDRFKRVGSHVEIEVPISVSEALLGAEIKVPTLDGSILLKVPAGVSSGQKLRVAGKGVPARGKEIAGDEHVILKIVTPKTIDPEFKAAIEAWQMRQPFSPREGASS